MKFFSSPIKAFRTWLHVPATDPDNERRRRLLNILLSGSIIVSFLMALYLGILLLLMPLDTWRHEAGLMPIVDIAVLIFSTVLLVINRRNSLVASQAFLVLITLAVTFVDTPDNLVRGSSLFLLTVPMLISSLLIESWWSFVSLAINIVLLVILNTFTVEKAWADLIINGAGLGFVALVVWLTARSLEQTLRDLRILNQELDIRVAERTRELYQALTREHAEVAKTQAIIISIADGVIVFNPDGKAIVVNPALSILLGLAPNQILDHSFEELAGGAVPNTQRETALRALRSTSLAGSTGPLPFARFEWREKTLLVSFAPVRDDAGQIIGTVAVFHDFTREAELEAMKSRFVSMVSHELRTPLNAILGYADMLLEAVYEPLNEDQQDVVRRILSNTNRQLSIVNDLLDRAQLEAGRLILRCSSFSPAALLDELCGMMNTIVQTKSLRLVTRLEPDVPAALYGDQQRLHQILVNLVTNATKFTEKGLIGVRLYCPDEAHWALQVVDTGKGISPEAQQFIFDPFRQVDETATRSHKGVGLGLSIVRDLVSLMKGEIKVASILGKGSTFTIVLPIEQEPIKESTT